LPICIRVSIAISPLRQAGGARTVVKAQKKTTAARAICQCENVILGNDKATLDTLAGRVCTAWGSDLANNGVNLGHHT
jgi:hypothetical protein